MDIKGSYKGPARKLSNVTPRRFLFDGETITSVEALWQSVKFKDPLVQKRIWSLPWREAQEVGRQQDWQKDQLLYWRGTSMPRQSLAYQEFIDDVYRAVARNRSFRKHLLASGTAMLEHTIGESDPRKTVLTSEEFISRLLWIRAELRMPKSQRKFLST